MNEDQLTPLVLGVVVLCLIWMVVRRPKRGREPASRGKNGAQHRAQNRGWYWSQPCIYRGVEMDSLTERELAVWCDRHGVKWHRTPRGVPYHWQGERGVYWCDFRLDNPPRDWAPWVEVKGAWWQVGGKEAAKAQALANATGQDVLIMVGRLGEHGTRRYRPA